MRAKVNKEYVATELFPVRGLKKSVQGGLVDIADYTELVKLQVILYSPGADLDEGDFVYVSRTHQGRDQWKNRLPEGREFLMIPLSQVMLFEKAPSLPIPD